ncbi:hypothetical protein COCSUDRAFT_54579 [Coccomyxa subellipsoidea C-169]|uniref:Uncharacterized protein n=1 Tax=Coccomyxa subellipsoidea (strain C-169) TaxID=574566 RepID=I0YMQ2_COCSC|nr:hypothetical protein COCSUDRAFT_54579 [Coccomyxa subellipsoidea C-169]EIE19671.1 hypothetical protein COCSUDRAFT_54579 [Coccomyxa subellipsoidea C-169]|eukprot:XP_005644215.1 hypothetical protein COCSUDRAFT_54579 [Coccomyxa subellipsoidea C-169]
MNHPIPEGSVARADNESYSKIQGDNYITQGCTVPSHDGCRISSKIDHEQGNNGTVAQPTRPVVVVKASPCSLRYLTVPLTSKKMMPSPKVMKLKEESYALISKLRWSDAQRLLTPYTDEVGNPKSVTPKQLQDLQALVLAHLGGTLL